MFYEDIRIKQYLSDISIFLLSILYNSKFILMATPLKTNAVVMVVNCTIKYYKMFKMVKTSTLILMQLQQVLAPLLAHAY